MSVVDLSEKSLACLLVQLETAEVELIHYLENITSGVINQSSYSISKKQEQLLLRTAYFLYSQSY